jgi:hypothetical protein
VDWIRLFQDRDKWQASMNVVMELRDLRTCNEGPYITSNIPAGFHKKDSFS